MNRRSERGSASEGFTFGCGFMLAVIVVLLLLTGGCVGVL